MSMFNDILRRSEDNERECIANATIVSVFAKKISIRTLVISPTSIRNKVVFYWQRKTTRRMGQSRWIDDDQTQRKRTPSFPCYESIATRNAQKHRRWTIINTLLCRWEYDWNFFAQLFLLISSESTGQSQNCLTNIVLVKKERRDPCWQDKLTHPLFEPANLLMMKPRFSIEILAHQNLLQK